MPPVSDPSTKVRLLTLCWTLVKEHQLDEGSGPMWTSPFVTLTKMMKESHGAFWDEDKKPSF